MNKDSPSKNRSKRQRRRKPPLAITLTRLAFSKLGPLFPSLLGAWAYRLWFSTRRFKAPRREQPWMENAYTEVVELDGIPVMTYQWGNPLDPLVILLHGWNGRGSQMAAFAEPLVEAGFRVLAYDAPGHGKTPGNSTNIFILARVLAALANKLGPLFGIVGHSFGGMTAALALSRGLKVQRVILISTPADFTHLIDLFATAMHIPPAVKHNLVQRLLARFGQNLFDDINTHRTCRKLNHIPALIIHDEKDLDVPARHARQIHENWPGSQMLLTKGLGHKRVLYHRKVIEAACDFLAKNT